MAKVDKDQITRELLEMLRDFVELAEEHRAMCIRTGERAWISHNMTRRGRKLVTKAEKTITQEKQQ